jgi:hypothetical protein
VLKIHASEPSGDILIFLPTAEDIESCIRMTEELKKATPGGRGMQLSLLPLYAALPHHMQTAPFQKSPPNTRKATFATTIAETSVTLPDVKFVVDAGFVKQPYFDSTKGFERLLVTATSQSSARQRTGRAGRTAPGKCYRLYVGGERTERESESETGRSCPTTDVDHRRPQLPFSCGERTERESETGRSCPTTEVDARNFPSLALASLARPLRSRAHNFLLLRSLRSRARNFLLLRSRAHNSRLLRFASLAPPPGTRTTRSTPSSRPRPPRSRARPCPTSC